MLPRHGSGVYECNFKGAQVHWLNTKIRWYKNWVFFANSQQPYHSSNNSLNEITKQKKPNFCIIWCLCLINEVWSLIITCLADVHKFKFVQSRMRSAVYPLPSTHNSCVLTDRIQSMGEGTDCLSIGGRVWRGSAREGCRFDPDVSNCSNKYICCGRF